MDLSKINLEKCRSISEEGRKRIVKPIFINQVISDSDRDSIKENVDIENYGFNIEKLYHIDDDGNRSYHNLLSSKFSDIFEKKEVESDNKFIQAKTKPSFFENLNKKFIKLGNRDLMNGHTILIRTLTGQDKYKLDDNILFIKSVLNSISYIKDNYSILEIPTTFTGDLKETCLFEYENARKLDKNLIIIYGQKLDTGVDIPEVNPDIIFNLSKLGSTDVAVQVLGRIERANVIENKKFCFFFDFNITNILSSIYSNKSLNKSKNEYEFLYEYKDSIFNLSDTELIDSDDNYIKELSLKVNDLLNKESDNRSFYNLATNNEKFSNIYTNSTKEFSTKSSNNEDLAGDSKKLIDRKEKDNEDRESSELTDETKNEIQNKLEVSDVIPEIFKVYTDIPENNCKTTKEILYLILSNNEYCVQLKHNLGKMIKELNIKSNENEETKDIIDHILNSIQYNNLNNDLLYKNKIEPINRSKINIDKFFI
jgi:hypothetical protein